MFYKLIYGYLYDGKFFLKNMLNNFLGEILVKNKVNKIYIVIIFCFFLKLILFKENYIVL